MKLTPKNALQTVLRVTVALGIYASLTAAYAEIQERRTFIPVSVTLNTGEVVKRDMELVIFEDDTRKGPQPVAVFGHGYPGGNISHSTWAWLFSHRKALHELVGLGFTVVMPMRLGQGGTGGMTLEGGGCEKTAEEFGHRFENITQQLLQAAAWVQSQGLSSGHMVYVGQSAGGSGAIALSAKRDLPFKALINFAAGSGRARLPDFPCAPEAYEAAVSHLGQNAVHPMLWIYGLNDYFWGAKWPVKWSKAYEAAGGKHDFHQVESNTLDGHDLFRRSPEVWVPIVKQYLAKLGWLQDTAQ